MHSNIASLVSGTVYILLMSFVFYAAFKRGRFWCLILFYEYFYIIGLGIYPVLAGAGLIDLPDLALSYENRNGEPWFLTYLHICGYAFGAAFGWFGLRSYSKNIGQTPRLWLGRNSINNSFLFYALSIFSISTAVLYFYIVGFETAVLNASLARGGDFSGLSEYDRYQYLKTLAMTGLFSMIFVPHFIAERRSHVGRIFVIVLVIAVLTYLISVARVIFFDTILLFVLLFAVLRHVGRKFIFFAGIVSLFIIFLLIYGKVFVGVFGQFLVGGDFDLGESNSSLLTYVLGHFSHLPYSIDAGIRSFFSGNGGVALDVGLAPLGVFPSFVYSTLDLDFLSYQLVPIDLRMSCINTQYFGTVYPCSVPPYITGFSAYIAPVVAGFLFAFARFFFYSVLSDMWNVLKYKPSLLWFPMLMLFLGNRIMLFIPNTIAFSSFVLIALFGFFAIKRFMVRTLHC